LGRTISKKNDIIAKRYLFGWFSFDLISAMIANREKKVRKNGKSKKQDVQDKKGQEKNTL